jgi:hypothetical protein
VPPSLNVATTDVIWASPSGSTTKTWLLLRPPPSTVTDESAGGAGVVAPWVQTPVTLGHVATVVKFAAAAGKAQTRPPIINARATPKAPDERLRTTNLLVIGP